MCIPFVSCVSAAKSWFSEGFCYLESRHYDLRTSPLRGTRSGELNRSAACCFHTQPVGTLIGPSVKNYRLVTDLIRTLSRHQCRRLGPLTSSVDVGTIEAAPSMTPFRPPLGGHGHSCRDLRTAKASDDAERDNGCKDNMASRPPCTGILGQELRSWPR